MPSWTATRKHSPALPPGQRQERSPASHATRQDRPADYLTVRWPHSRADLARPRAWVSLILGLICVGAGIGMMLDARIGVSSVDVFFSGLANTSSLTVGTVVIVASLVMVAATWPLGIHPGVGTAMSILLIGPAVDGARYLDSLLGVGTWDLPARGAWWLAGLTVFVAGVLGLFSANLGVSPYDHVTLAIAKLTGRSLGFARFLADGALLALGVLLGGSWGFGTVALLLVVPFALNQLLPPARRLIEGTKPTPDAHLGEPGSPPAG